MKRNSGQAQRQETGQKAEGPSSIVKGREKENKKIFFFLDFFFQVVRVDF